MTPAVVVVLAAAVLLPAGVASAADERVRVAVAPARIVDEDATGQRSYEVRFGNVGDVPFGLDVTAEADAGDDLPTGPVGWSPSRLDLDPGESGAVTVDVTAPATVRVIGVLDEPDSDAAVAVGRGVAAVIYAGVPAPDPPSVPPWWGAGWQWAIVALVVVVAAVAAWRDRPGDTRGMTRKGEKEKDA